MGSNVSAAGAAEVQRVLDGVRRLVQGLREVSSQTESRSGLTAAQHFVLRRVAESDGLTVTDLAARTFTHQSSVSAVVSRLVARGLLARKPDASDRRRRVVTLTAAGRRAMRASASPAQERLIGTVLEMPRPRRRDIARALEQMADAIAASRHPAMFFEKRGRS